jgi:hypothetical protein
MEEAEAIASWLWKADPVAACRIQEAQGAYDIGLNKWLWRVDRAVHVGFRRKVYDGIDVMLLEQTGYQGLVADIAFLENVPGVGGEVGQVGWVARVGEEVEIDDPAEERGTLSETLANEVAADESAATSNKDIHELWSSSLLGLLALCEHFVEAGFKFVEAGAGNNDGVSAPMGFFGDFEKPASVILAKLDDEVLPFDLKFAQGDGLFHMERVSILSEGRGWYQPKILSAPAITFLEAKNRG